MAIKYTITPGFRSHWLTAIEQSPRVRGKRYWLFRCDCGNIKRINIYPVIEGRVKSCGCQQNKLVADARTRHGHQRRGKTTKEYRTWQHIWARCTRTKVASFKYYGALGVTVCDRWKLFENFLADIGQAPSPAHSIDRINPFGNYEPTNCRWATAREQRANRRQQWNQALSTQPKK